MRVKVSHPIFNFVDFLTDFVDFGIIPANVLRIRSALARTDTGFSTTSV